MNPKIFFGELKRRNVYKVGVAYAVVAWLLMQIASQIFPFFEIPNWVVRLVVLLLIIGFPVALIIAWAFEVTPEERRSLVIATRWKRTPSILQRIKKDAWGLSREEEAVARAYTLLGDFDRAVPLLQHALAVPTHTSLTPAFLRLDPFWDPVRNDPRFQKLCEGKLK